MKEEINKAFKSELGEQAEELHSTSDERIFLRHSEAVEHAKNLSDKTIKDWHKSDIEKIKNMGFEVIQHEQTPLTPEIKDAKEFADNNKDVISAFKEYAISRRDGIGLAANQCSLDGERFNLRVIAVKDINTHECRIAIDPKIVRYHGVVREKAEGCLTWRQSDGKYFIIIADRHHFVDVEFYTPDGEFHQETYKGFQAQVWQHEVNHINGVEEEITSEGFILRDAPDKNSHRNDACPCQSGKKYKRCCIEEK